MVRNFLFALQKIRIIQKGSDDHIMEIIKENDTENKYAIKFLNESHLSLILQLQDLVVKRIGDPKTYYVRSSDYLYKRLAVENSAMGIFKGHELLGFHIASFPGMDEENLGEDIGLEPEELFQVVKMGPTAIHPEYRNIGLLRMVASEHFKVIADMGYSHICLTIAPNNYPSLKSTLKHGFVIQQLKQKYGSLLRYVLHLDLKKPYAKSRYSVKVSSTDIESQRFILKLGFYGYSILKNADGSVDIVFGRQ